MKGSQIDQSSWSHDIWKLEKNSGTFQRCRVLTSLFDGARLRRGSTWSTVMDPKASLRFLRLLKLLIATGVISSRQRSILWRTSISSLSPSVSKVTKKRVLKKKPIDPEHAWQAWRKDRKKDGYMEWDKLSIIDRNDCFASKYVRRIHSLSSFYN